MKVLGIIPARYSSSRFPGKPLIDLKGKTMIHRVYEGAKKSTILSEVIVATDDERIFAEVEKFGGKVVMTSRNHPSGTDRCAEAARIFGGEYDVVINIQGDEPLVDAQQLDQLLAVFADNKVQIATLATKKITAQDLENPNRIKLVINSFSEALYFSRSAIPNTNHSSETAKASYPFLRHIGLYAYRSDILQELTQLNTTVIEQVESLEQLRWLYYGYSIKIAETEIETPNIDTPADVEAVIAML